MNNVHHLNKNLKSNNVQEMLDKISEQDPDTVLALCLKDGNMKFLQGQRKERIMMAGEINLIIDKFKTWLVSVS